MRKISRMVLIAVVTFFVLSASGANEARAQINDILNRMERHHKALQSLKANVTREKVNVQLGNETDRYFGKIVLLPKEGIKFAVRLDWTKPKEEILSVVNGKYLAYVPGIKQAYMGNSSSNRAKEKGGNVLGIMSMSKEALKANYSVQYLGDEQIEGGIRTWRLKLSPKATASFKFAELWVDGNGMPLKGRVVALNDESDTFLLQNLFKNEKINPSIFKINLPKGTKLIEE